MEIIEIKKRKVFNYLINRFCGLLFYREENGRMFVKPFNTVLPIVKQLNK